MINKIRLLKCILVYLEILSILVISGCSNTKPPIAKPITGVSPIMKFDPIFDESIVESDPRIKSIIGVTKSNPGSKIVINYFNDDSKVLSYRLYSIFMKNKALVNLPINANISKNKVEVRIEFPKTMQSKINASGISKGEMLNDR